MKGAVFGTTINCMDGRTQEPISRWMRGRLSLDYLDTITEPGADKLLAEGPAEAIEGLKAKVQISTQKHGSKVVSVVGHHDCAGNPVPKEKHVEQIRQGVERIRSWKLGVRVLGLWVDENWHVEKLCDTDAE